LEPWVETGAAVASPADRAAGTDPAARGSAERPEAERGEGAPSDVEDGRATQPEDPDAQLMLAFQAGDDAAFDALFRRWSAPVLRHLERLVREAATAEELMQEAFLRVFRARERYQPQARFTTWLFTIATNLALNELRRPRRRASHRSAEEEEDDRAPLALASGGAPADEVAHARRVGAEVEESLAALPERQRAALLLAAVEGLSYAEIAESLETTEKSVKALVHRARVALAQAMNARGARPLPGGEE
jgi:RNA polymerase sigma-70 factor (ECF subfamily)